MKSEAEFKKHFKASVKAHGGFSISLAAPMLPGIPDLYVVLPGFAPVLLEAKWLKEVPDKFNRSAKFTELQKHFIKKCNEVHKGIAWGLVGWKYNKKIFAKLVYPDRNVDSVSLYINMVSINKQTEHFDVRQMFELYVPKMNLTYAPICASVPVAVDAQIGELSDSTTQPLAV